MHLMMRLIFIAVAILILSTLAACGNKGPLFIEKTEIPAVSMTPTTPPAAVTTQDESEK
ncbi:MAG: lipoprotein [Nitrosomonas sp.]|nr:lipoprotein [Nitrosomonas sp.]